MSMNFFTKLCLIVSLVGMILCDKSVKSMILCDKSEIYISILIYFISFYLCNVKKISHSCQFNEIALFSD